MFKNYLQLHNLWRRESTAPALKVGLHSAAGHGVLVAAPAGAVGSPTHVGWARAAQHLHERQAPQARDQPGNKQTNKKNYLHKTRITCEQF